MSPSVCQERGSGCDDADISLSSGPAVEQLHHRQPQPLEIDFAMPPADGARAPRQISGWVMLPRTDELAAVIAGAMA